MHPLPPAAPPARYAVKFERLQGDDGQETVQFLQIMGALIRVVDRGGDDAVDTREHAVSGHVMRLKPRHPGPYAVGDPVQLRLANEWVPGTLLTSPARTAAALLPLVLLLTAAPLRCAPSAAPPPRQAR